MQWMSSQPLRQGRGGWLSVLGWFIEGYSGLPYVGDCFFICSARGQRLQSWAPAYSPFLRDSDLRCLAVVAGAYAPMDHRLYVWSYRGHVLHQSFYIVQGGLALFLFLFVAYYKLTWDRKTFGIALGFGILFCEHMATWSIMATGALSYSRYPLLDFLNMATYHVAVIIWCYYLLAREKVPTTSAVSLPENNLAIWNRELERLLQR